MLAFSLRNQVRNTQDKESDGILLALESFYKKMISQFHFIDLEKVEDNDLPGAYVVYICKKNLPFPY